MKKLLSMILAALLTVTMSANLNAKPINSDLLKPDESKLHTFSRSQVRSYILQKDYCGEGEFLKDYHFAPTFEYSFGTWDIESRRCNNTYREPRLLKHLSSYEKEGVTYEINRYSLYCTSCHSLVGEATIRLSEEDAKNFGGQGSYYTMEELSALYPKQGHIGDCESEYYHICELDIPVDYSVDFHASSDGRTCLIYSLTKRHEMYCADCGGYLGSYDKMCCIEHSRCKKYDLNCLKLSDEAPGNACAEDSECEP